jgi:serine/threonine protein kinase
VSLDQKLVPGMVLGRYELLVPIAQGGMATVWAARQRGTRGFNKTVAIKTMLPTLSDDPQFEQMFLDEAALAARIHHPNVAEILDLGEQDDILYIVMEWVEGEALSVLQKMARKNGAQVPMRVSLRICQQACAALHAAHELRDETDTELELVHRDVSPQNILCTYDGIVKLVDFGVAKAVGRAGGETTAGQLKGKVPYMSPEQARGSHVDRRTDIFALGIVMYRLTTGLHPFHGESDLVTMRNIISRPLIRPRVRDPGFPQEVESIIVKCLHKEPSQRYQTMLELGQALEHALGAASQGAGHGGAADDIGAFVRSTMGDRGIKRRAEIRDAVRTADERYATGVHSRVEMPPPSSAGAITVTDVVLTQMTSGLHEELLSEPTSSTARDAPTRLTPLTPAPPASSSWPSNSSPQLPTPSRTDLPVEIPMGWPHARRSGWLLVTAAALAAVVVGVVALRGIGTRSRAAAARGAGSAAPSVTMGDTPKPAVMTVASVASVVTPAVPASASAAPVSAVPTPAIAGPLPVAGKGRLGHKGHAGPAAATTGAAPAATPDADPDKPVKTFGAPGAAPIYTNPGF